MRKSVLSALGLVAVLSVPAAAAGTPGPFVGAVSQGQTGTHEYDNNPANNPCIQVMTWYTVTLTYAPANDVLTLSAGSQTVNGIGGVATASVHASWCTSFSVSVTGTSVTVVAPYAVTVTRTMAGGVTS